MNYSRRFFQNDFADDEEQEHWIVRWSPLIGVLIVIGFALVCMYGF